MGRFSQWAREPYDEDETRKALTHDKVAAQRRIREAAHSSWAANIRISARFSIAFLAVLLTAGAGWALVSLNGEAARVESQAAAARSETASVKRSIEGIKAGKDDAAAKDDAKSDGNGDKAAQPSASDVERDKAAQAIVDIQNSGENAPNDKLKAYFPDTNPKSYMGFAISPLSRWNTIVPDCTWKAYTQPGGQTTAFVCSQPDGAVKGIATARWEDDHYTDFVAHIEGNTANAGGTNGASASSAGNDGYGKAV